MNYSFSSLLIILFYKGQDEVETGVAAADDMFLLEVTSVSGVIGSNLYRSDSES